jgi:hypothetical protein
MLTENFIDTSINSKKEDSAKLTLNNDILTITIKPERWTSYLAIDIYDYEKTASKRGKSVCYEMDEEFIVKIISNS